MTKEDLPHWYVTDMLNYEPDTGLFRWKINYRQNKQGQIAGSCKGSNEYVRITLARSAYKAHRLAWFYVHGVWPTQDIDHINHDKTDNRLANLREVSRSQNIQNTRKHIDSICAYKGVTPLTRDKSRFVAQIRHNGKQRKLGVFATQKEAHDAYCAAASKHFGEFFFAG